MSNSDFITLSTAVTGSYGPFILSGGNYGITAVMGSTSTIDLSILGPDGTTQVDVVAQLKGSVATTSYQTVYLPPGSYTVVIGTAAASLAVQRIRV
jgi:hypothetical protein